MSSSIPSWQTLTAHAQPFRGARDLAFCLKVPLDSLLVWASSEGSGETARMRRLAWTFAARIDYKYHIRLTRSRWSWRIEQLPIIWMYIASSSEPGVVLLNWTLSSFDFQVKYSKFHWIRVVRFHTSYPGNKLPAQYCMYHIHSVTAFGNARLSNSSFSCRLY